MAEAVGTTQTGGGSKKGCCAGCLIAAVLLGVLGVVGLLTIGRSLATARLEQVLQQQAQAAEWDVQMGTMAAPKVILGQPADIEISGREVVVDKASGQTLGRVHCVLNGLVIDRQQGKVASLASGTFEIAMTSAQLDSALAAKMPASQGHIKTRFEGTNLVLDGEMPLPQGLGALKLSALTTPELQPPGSMRLAVDDIKLEPPAALKNLPGFDLQGISKQMKELMSKEMTTELFKPNSGATLTSVAIEGEELVLKGTISAEALSGGR